MIRHRSDSPTMPDGPAVLSSPAGPSRLTDGSVAVRGNPLDLVIARRNVEAAFEEVYALCRGAGPGGHRFRMTVPPDPDRDSDFILIAALEVAEAFLDAAEAEREPVPA